MATALLLIALAIVLGYVLATRYPRTTRRWFDRLVAARRLVFMVFAILIAIVFIASGSLTLMLIGFLIALYGVLYLIFDPEGWIGGLKAWFQ